MTMPLQKPWESEQSVQTPLEFTDAVRKFLKIKEFSCDLAASEENTQAPVWIDESINSLEVSWKDFSEGWCWLNPPYKNINLWVRKAWEERNINQISTAILLPASVSTMWWASWVHNKAHVISIMPRIKFVGHTSLYPKDLVLLLYAPHIEGGYRNWRWN